MPRPSPIIARADALMHRKRQSGSEPNDIPMLTDSLDEYDDIPTLTDVDNGPTHRDSPRTESPDVATTEITEIAQNEHNASLVIDPELRDQLVYELTRRIEERLKAALPQIISSTVRDFLAEQEMIANS